MNRLIDRDRFCDDEGDCKADSEAAAESSHDAMAFSHDDKVSSAVLVFGGVSAAEVCCWPL